MDELGNLFFRDTTNNKLTVKTPDGDIKEFDLLPRDDQIIGPATYENGTLTSTIMRNGNTVTIDHDGNVLSEIEGIHSGNIGERMLWFYRNEDTNPPTLTMSLMDKDFNKIIPNGIYNELRGTDFDTFVIAFIGDHWGEGINRVINIYNTDGQLLLEGVYGYTVEIPGDGLIVYKSAEECVILRPDGTYTVINVPAVEKIFMRA
jgi:hypothetical protein